VVYGVQWLPAVLPMRILAIFGLFMSLVALNGYLFQGMGVPSIAFKLGILRLAIIAALLAPMIRWNGIAGAAYAVTFGIFVHWLTGTFFLRKHLSVRPAQLWSAIRRPLLTTILMAMPVGALLRFVPASPAILLCAAALVGLTVYAALNWTAFRAIGREFHQLGSR
jgi:O-antigen/teichoic acid export membrane protein